VRTTAALTDPEFGVSEPGLKLVRLTEMYQWKEESRTETRRTMGGAEETVTTYSYVQTWSDSRIDSSRFRRTEGHVNPQMRYTRREFMARDAMLGAFRPGERVLAQLSADTDVLVDRAQWEPVRRRLGQAAQVVDGRIFVGTDPARPRIGDQRIGYRAAAAGPVSIVGRQVGTDFQPYQTMAGDQLLMVRAGSISAADMFGTAQRGNAALTWILRGIGALVMFVGWGLIFRPLVVVADVVPIVGDILGFGAGLVAFLLTLVLAPLIVAIAWFWYRPLVSIAVLVVAGAAAAGLVCFVRWRRPAPAARGMA
jgi:hypothetical protein